MTPVRIMGVPERARSIAYLRRRIPDAELILDRKRSAIDTYRRALDHPGPLILLEDDVILTVQWRDKIEHEIATHPEAVIVGFSRNKADIGAESHWSPMGTYPSNCCVVYPPGVPQMIAAFLDDPATHEWWAAEGHYAATDVSAGRCLAANGHDRYWRVLPSLVDHRALPSAIRRGRSTRRQSLTFVDPDLPTEDET